jgi:choline dehydrogenase-like flavoprotein
VTVARAKTGKTLVAAGLARRNVAAYRHRQRLIAQDFVHFLIKRSSMAVELTDAQRRTLSAVADTYVAAVPPPDGAGDPDGFYARTGSQAGAPVAMEIALGAIDPALSAGLLMLVDALGQLGFADTPVESREGVLDAVAASSPEAAQGVQALRTMALAFGYSMIDDTGTNPFWKTIGFPAPGTAPALPHQIVPEEADGSGQIDADAIVVGSGAGGGVMAAELAAAGKKVIVLEGGDYLDGDTAIQLEILAAPSVFYRGGGMTTTVDGNVNLWAGATLGGGTTVNWSNCVRTPASLRANWSANHGVSGMDGAGYDEHLDAVMARIGANEEASVYNGPHLRMLDGAEKLGWSHRRAMLNLNGRLIESDRGSLLTYGDRTGAKQGTLRTYLVDAAAKDARVFTRATATRILVADGRAVGVQATQTKADGSVVQLTINAPIVVAACGALETAALLLRSGIGGPAVGRYLHLHPSVLLTGRYDDPQNPWEGPIQSALVDEFADPAAKGEDASGILIEGIASQIGASAATLPWTGAAEHKRRMASVAHTAALVAIVADRGAGRITIDGSGNAVHHYPADDPRDRAAWYKGLDLLARIHAAAGAAEIWPLTPSVATQPWRRGEDLDAAIRSWQEVPLGFGGHYLGSAHQMGGARIGTDPLTSVAKPTGELHDVSGVWIGDTSVFPTALGVNPMVTCMAMARRTAFNIVG